MRKLATLWKTFLHQHFVPQHGQLPPQESSFDNWLLRTIAPLPAWAQRFLLRSLLGLIFLGTLCLALALAAILASILTWLALLPIPWKVWFFALASLFGGEVIVLYAGGFLYKLRKRQTHRCIMCGRASMLLCYACNAPYCSWCFERTHVHTAEERAAYRQFLEENF